MELISEDMDSVKNRLVSSGPRLDQGSSNGSSQEQTTKSIKDLVMSFVSNVAGTISSKVGNYFLQDNTNVPKWLNLPDKEPFTLCGKVGFMTSQGNF